MKNLAILIFIILLSGNLSANQQCKGFKCSLGKYTAYGMNAQSGTMQAYQQCLMQEGQKKCQSYKNSCDASPGVVISGGCGWYVCSIVGRMKVYAESGFDIDETSDRVKAKCDKAEGDCGAYDCDVRYYY